MLNFILKWRNRLIAFSFDTGMIPFAWFGAYLLLFNLEHIPPVFLEQSIFLFLPLLVLQTTAFWFFGLYRGVWHFASIPDLIRIFKAVTVGTLSIYLIFLIAKFNFGLPRVIPILYGLLLATSLASSRALFRWLKDYRHFFRDSERVLIVGAGNAGEGLVRDLLRHKNHVYQPIIIVDDSPLRVGREIHGIRVIGRCEKIPALAEYYQIDLILIGLPSATSAEMRRIVNLCEQTKLPFRTLPGINDLAKGCVDIKLLRHVSLEDLLGRDQFQLNRAAIEKDFQKKIILVSGGGGSIGSELCRQLASLKPEKLIVIDNSEFNLYSIDLELRKNFVELKLECLLLNITDTIGVQEVFQKFRPDIVFHAAAYKHVPLLETHGRIAIHNNIIGTHVLAKTAVDQNVSKFVLISTDKAVNPANLMGATKRAAEMICQNLQEKLQTKFITVRFGNVLDSAGSVVPLFRKQIQEGGPLTVTHPEISRYFMSIPEASQLIIQATTLGNGGEIFVLDMGEPIKISYLAEQMIKLAGKSFGRDIEIVYTGLRPGEKLYEELFYDNEELSKTVHNKIMLAKARKVDPFLMQTTLEKIQEAYQKNDESTLYLLLQNIVPEYQTISAKPPEPIEKREDLSIAVGTA